MFFLRKKLIILKQQIKKTKSQLVTFAIRNQHGAFKGLMFWMVSLEFLIVLKIKFTLEYIVNQHDKNQRENIQIKFNWKLKSN